MSTKLIFPVLVLMLAITIFAGCQATSTPTPQPAPTNTAAPAPTNTPAPAPTAAPAIAPAVTVEDQRLSDGTVTIASVISDGPGWIVIHAQADGKPGPILGYAAVTAGENKNVAVDVDSAKATDILYAMLHVDAGTAGSFEFPNGADGPVKVDGKIITPAFNVILPAADISETATVMLGGTEQLGSFLVDAQGITLYTFGNDGENESACYGGCATAWPPLTIDAGATPVLAANIPGELGVISRDDGSSQITYNGTPLYYFAQDKNPGDTKGEGLKGLWYVATPSAM